MTHKRFPFAIRPLAHRLEVACEFHGESLPDGAKQREAVAVGYRAPLQTGRKEYKMQGAAPSSAYARDPDSDAILKHAGQ